MKKNILKNKKGEMSTQQIVLLIILITSFIVILFFLMRLGFKENSEKELCYNSVVTRASGTFGKNTPLKCKTEYICISKTNSCDKLTSSIVKKVSKEEEIYKILAESFADCWWMFGEGKLDYIGEKLQRKNYCSICAQIAFDDSIKDIFPSGTIDQESFYEYLSKNSYGSEESYLEYLYEISDFDYFKENFISPEDSSFGKIDISKQHFVIMAISSKTSDKSKWSIGPVVMGEKGKRFLPPLIIEMNSKSEEFKSLDCDSIETLA